MVIVKNCPSTAVNLGRYVASCNTPNDLPHRVCIPNKTDYLNLDVFNMITRINESKKLTNHISCKCECEFHEKKCNSNQNILINDGKMFITINADASVNIKKRVCKKIYNWNPATYSCKNGK